MQFLTGLFDGQGNTIVTAFFALVFVLALIVFGMWVLKVVFRTTSGISRGRSRRLTVVERLPVDGRRQLLLVRRDGVEHVIMTGGGQDLLVETGIPAEGHFAAPPADQRPATSARPAAADTAAPQPAANPAVQPAAAGPVLPVQPPAAPTPIPAAPAAPASVPAPRPVLQGHSDTVRDALASSLQRRTPSLRHTALLRPVSVMEPALTPMPPLPGDKSGRPAPDSDRTPQNIDDGGRDGLARAANLGGDKSGAGPT
jgi:hypothetical protein